MSFERASGLLLHITSLPSYGGIGDLGPAAYEFADFLAAAKQRLWQVLPLGPTGYGNSPYAALSAFAGNPLLISLEKLSDWGWIDGARISDLPGRSGSLRFCRKPPGIFCTTTTPLNFRSSGRGLKDIVASTTPGYPTTRALRCCAATLILPVGIRGRRNSRAAKQQHWSASTMSMQSNRPSNASSSLRSMSNGPDCANTARNATSALLAMSPSL